MGRQKGGGGCLFIRLFSGIIYVGIHGCGDIRGVEGGACFFVYFWGPYTLESMIVGR